MKLSKKNLNMDDIAVYQLYEEQFVGSGHHIQKIIFYIFIQLITLWSIFHQMTSTEVENRFETTGVIILTGVFFLYAYKTIKLLNRSLNSNRAKETKVYFY